jgi:hypothetical protein
MDMDSGSEQIVFTCFEIGLYLLVAIDNQTYLYLFVTKSMLLMVLLGKSTSKQWNKYCLLLVSWLHSCILLISVDGTTTYLSRDLGLLHTRSKAPNNSFFIKF